VKSVSVEVDKGSVSSEEQRRCRATSKSDN
jgi:hypothetical protein